MKYLLFSLLLAVALFAAAGQKFVFGQTTTTSPTQSTTTPSGAPSTGMGGLYR